MAEQHFYDMKKMDCLVRNLNIVYWKATSKMNYIYENLENTALLLGFKI